MKNKIIYLKLEYFVETMHLLKKNNNNWFNQHIVQRRILQILFMSKLKNLQFLSFFIFYGNYSQTKKFINDGILNDGDVNPIICKILYI